MRIYVDNVSVYANTSNALDILLPLATGTHSVVIQAWDSSGAVFKASQTLTVAGGLSVSSPVSGAMVGAPLQVVASASAANPITAMAIYLDNNNVFMASAGSVNV